MKNNKTVWVITGHSESGDDSGPMVYGHKPTVEEQKKFIEDTGEEVDGDGDNDFGSYVSLNITKCNIID